MAHTSPNAGGNEAAAGHAYSLPLSFALFFGGGGGLSSVVFGLDPRSVHLVYSLSPYLFPLSLPPSPSSNAAVIARFFVNLYLTWSRNGLWRTSIDEVQGTVVLPPLVLLLLFLLIVVLPFGSYSSSFGLVRRVGLNAAVV